jgi:Tol biopolymer transport system component
MRFLPILAILVCGCPAPNQAVATIELPERALANSVAFSPNGKTLAAGCNDNIIRLWDVATGRPLPIVLTHEGWVSPVAFAPDGKTLVAGSADSCVTEWDAETGKRAVALERDEIFGTERRYWGTTWSVVYAPDGRSVAGGGEEGRVKVWDVATRRVIRTFLIRRGSAAYSMAFSPDSKTLAVAYASGPVRLWDLETGQVTQTIALRPDTYHFVSVAFSPDGKTLAIGNGKERESGEVLIWDVARGKALKRLGGHTWPVLSVAFSPDGRTLVSGGQDETLRLWEIASGRELARLTGHTDTVTCVAFSPDGRTLASGGYDETVRMWDVSGFTRAVRPAP